MVRACEPCKAMTPMLERLEREYGGRFVQAFVERLIPDPSGMEHRFAVDAITLGQETIAEAHLRNAIALDPANDAARIDMVTMLLERGDPAGACGHFDLAELHVARREFAPAMDQLLEIARRDRTFHEDIGRRKLLDVFEMAAAHPELVADYRSRLSSVIF